jgi:hypothetical protein
MAVLTFGPVITVQLYTPRVMQPYAEPITALAEINTAYTQTFIQEGIATSLGLEPVGKIRIATATRPPCEVHEYLLRIIFPADNQAFEVVAAEVPFMVRPKANGRIKCLIGRDILRHVILMYNGPANTFSLKF